METNPVKLDLVISGIAGQGVVSMARVIVRAALAEGFDAHFTAHSGITQLEGPVTAHVRVGSPAGASYKVGREGADAVVALEPLEALRIRPYLAPGGKAFVADLPIPPVEARQDSARYPKRADVENAYEGSQVVWVPVCGRVESARHPAAAGAVCLGALTGSLPVVDRDRLVEALRRERPDLADEEAESFFSGFSFVTGRDE